MCDILADELAASGAALREQGAQVETQTIDLASPDSIRSAFEKIAAGGGIDGPVNNAALATGVGGKTMMEYDIDLWDRVMQVNVRGTACESGGGAAAGTQPARQNRQRGVGHCAVGRAAPDGLCRQQRRADRDDPLDGARAGSAGDLRQRHRTGLTRVEATEYVPAERHQLYEQGRALAGAQHPDDVNGTVLYLLSSLADFVTGQLLPVNGGFVFN